MVYGFNHSSIPLNSIRIERVFDSNSRRGMWPGFKILANREKVSLFGMIDILSLSLINFVSFYGSRYKWNIMFFKSNTETSFSL